MNYRWITAGVIAVLALAAGCLAYVCLERASPKTAGADHDALGWVRHEFNLSGETLARVEALHQAYESVCLAHCHAIVESRDELRRLNTTNATPAEIATATTKARAVDEQCIASTEEHIRRIAAVIGGEEGRRYLAIVLPRVTTFDHTAPATPDLHPSSPHDHGSAK